MIFDDAATIHLELRWLERSKFWQIYAWRHHGNQDWTCENTGIADTTISLDGRVVDFLVRLLEAGLTVLPLDAGEPPAVAEGSESGESDSRRDSQQQDELPF